MHFCGVTAVLPYIRDLTKIFAPDTKGYTWPIFQYPHRRHPITLPDISVSVFSTVHTQGLPGIMYIRCQKLKMKCHFDKIFIFGCTWSCRNGNFQGRQWWKVHQNDNISISVMAFIEPICHSNSIILIYLTEVIFCKLEVSIFVTTLLSEHVI